MYSFVKLALMGTHSKYTLYRGWTFELVDKNFFYKYNLETESKKKIPYTWVKS